MSAAGDVLAPLGPELLAWLDEVRGFRNAPAGTLERWRFIAAGVMAIHRESWRADAAFADAVAAACFEAEQRGEPSSVWHECARLSGRPESCYCARCRPPVAVRCGWCKRTGGRLMPAGPRVFVCEDCRAGAAILDGGAAC